MRDYYRLIAYIYLSGLLLLAWQFLSPAQISSSNWVLGSAAQAAPGTIALALLTIAAYPEYRILTRKGQAGRVSGEAAPVSLDTSELGERAGFAKDVAGRKSDEGQQQWTRQVFDKSPYAIIIMDTEGKIADANAAALRLVEAGDKSDLVGKNAADFTAPHEQPHGRNGFKRALEEGAVRDQRYDFVTMRGAKVPVEGNAIAITAGADEVIGFIGIARDIRERVKMERSLEERTQDLRERVEEMACLNQASRIMADPHVARGYVLQQMVELITSSFRHAGAVGVRITCNGEAFTSPRFVETEWETSSDIKVFGEAGGVLQVYYAGESPGGPEADKESIFGQDRELFDTLAREMGQFIERSNAEEALRKSAETYRALVDNATDLIYMLDKDLRILSMNTAAAAFVGSRPDQLIGKRIPDIFPKEVAGGYAKNIEKVFSSGEAHSVEECLVGKDRRLWTSVNFNPVRDAAGNVVAVMGVGRDITDRRAAEEMLKSSQRELAVRSRISNIFLTTVDEGMYGEILAVILEALESPHGIFGYINEDGDLVCPSLTRDVWEQCAMPGKTALFRRQEWKGLWGRALAEKKTLCQNSPFVTPAGHILINKAVAVPIVHGDGVIGLLMVGNRATDYDGASIGLLETLADKVAPILGARLQGEREERRRRALQTEKESLRAQLLQSQKVEAIGMLAAGMAHDFNNILSSILGYSDIALLKAAPETPLHRELKEIKDAAIRGAGLTRRLLLFARRHPTEIALVDMGQAISSISEMLGRLVGDRITFDVKVDPGLWMIRGDKTSIEQVVTNVVVNARDAMPKGGLMSLKAENVVIRPGQSGVSPRARSGKYVRISVTDVGCGMDEATINRIFEPFFTTKEMGQGTGLGLSVAYGIMEQHGGWIDVESTPGAGSTLRLYFGALGHPAAAGGVDSRSPALGDLKGEGEKILVVDDESTIRGLIASILGKNGYKTFEAAGVAEALEVFGGEDGHFDLVLTDVALGDGTGVDLADGLLARKPGLRVLLTSGYTDERLTWAAICERGYHFLQKPFMAIDLLRAVRTALKSETEVTRNEQEMAACGRVEGG